MTTFGHQAITDCKRLKHSTESAKKVVKQNLSAATSSSRWNIIWLDTQGNVRSKHISLQGLSCPGHELIDKPGALSLFFHSYFNLPIIFKYSNCCSLVKHALDQHICKLHGSAAHHTGMHSMHHRHHFANEVLLHPATGNPNVHRGAVLKLIQDVAQHVWFPRRRKLHNWKQKKKGHTNNCYAAEAPTAWKAQGHDHPAPAGRAAGYCQPFASRHKNFNQKHAEQSHRKPYRQFSRSWSFSKIINAAVPKVFGHSASSANQHVLEFERTHEIMKSAYSQIDSIPQFSEMRCYSDLTNSHSSTIHQIQQVMKIPQLHEFRNSSLQRVIEIFRNSLNSSIGEFRSATKKNKLIQWIPQFLQYRNSAHSTSSDNSAIQ